MVTKWKDVRPHLESISDEFRFITDMHSSIVAKMIDTREELNITRKELSEKTCIPEKFLEDFERGIKSPTITHLYKISKALGLKLTIELK